MIQAEMNLQAWIDGEKYPPPPNTVVLHYYRNDDSSVTGPMASIADLYVLGEHHYKPTVWWMPIPALPNTHKCTY